MLYGISKSKDILLSSIAEALNENISKINTIDKISNNLSLSLDESIFSNYCYLAFDSLGDNPVFLVDDSDVIKPLGNKFEDLGIVRDGSSNEKSFEKGYHHTENVYRKNDWEKITYLRDKCKGKLKFNIRLKGENKECNVSVIRARITANKKWINIFLIYGLSDTPMMLASNIPIKSKEDVLRISKLYFNRWRIEEYFKFKKQEYNFENFRVRSLKSINNLNLLLTYTIGFIAIMSEKLGKNMFANEIIKE